MCVEKAAWGAEGAARVAETENTDELLKRAFCAAPLPAALRTRRDLPFSPFLSFYVNGFFQNQFKKRGREKAALGAFVERRAGVLHRTPASATRPCSLSQQLRAPPLCLSHILSPKLPILRVPRAASSTPQLLPQNTSSARCASACARAQIGDVVLGGQARRACVSSPAAPHRFVLPPRSHANASHPRRSASSPTHAHSD